MPIAPRVGDNMYGDMYADTFDELLQGHDDVNAVSGLLHELAGTGDVIEFGVGTGRLAIPLAALGHRVYGVDNSQRMLDRLAAKPGAGGVIPVLADCAEVRIDANASLVFSAFSTIFLLGTQDAQVQAVRNAAAHLPIGGRFLAETFVHDRTRLTNDQEVVVTQMQEQSATIRLGVFDPATQVIRTQKLTIAPDGVTFLPNRLRIIHPAELDLMARLAGMRLEFRWSDWERRTFDATSANSVAVYQKVAGHAI
jgi:SAM-dependent methyltransferase